MDKLNISIGRMRKAASAVLGRSRRVTGKQTDPDLMLYERLTPQDLEILEKKYGRDAVIDYVKAMAAKKVKNAT